MPYLIKNGNVANRADAKRLTNLREDADNLRNNPKVRVQICEDDFLLTSQDVAWFHEVFGHNLKAYPKGGHLGNLYIPEVQENLVQLFDK